ncbi:hypothetical protein OsI_04549 [Oryza sativa Indica Group]|uniref:Plant heme peroxidase family profile domain-containing protein n=1 Tax=Oryza sativa subsp. indica TaxID=39946 RepID=B8A6X3_ORYSI|nr:hypothetical protein OsI_04549 [Oryza sativa Indica Group]
MDGDGVGGSMHVVMLPWLAFGHILPFAEFAKRVARQGHRVTLFSTPRNTRRLIDVPPSLAGRIRVVDILLPRVEHLPEHSEATIDLPSNDLRPYLRRAYDEAFSRELSRLLQETGPSRLDWVLADYAAYWAPAAAARHGVPARAKEEGGIDTLGTNDPLSVAGNGRCFDAHISYGRQTRSIFPPGDVARSFEQLAACLPDRLLDAAYEHIMAAKQRIQALDDNVRSHLLSTDPFQFLAKLQLMNQATALERERNSDRSATIGGISSSELGSVPRTTGRQVAVAAGSGSSSQPPSSSPAPAASSATPAARAPSQRTPPTPATPAKAASPPATNSSSSPRTPAAPAPRPPQPPPATSPAPTKPSSPPAPKPPSPPAPSPSTTPSSPPAPKPSSPPPAATPTTKPSPPPSSPPAPKTVSSSSSSDATATAAGSGTETISFSSSGSNEFHDELLLAVDVHAGPALAKFLRAVLPERGAGGEGCRQGCDASVMIEGSGTERTDPANLSLGGFNVIDAAKRLLEAVCPVTVSCSDILVLAARDAVTFTGGPLVPVSLGRLDGLVSLASNVRANIIDTGFSVDAMARSFSAKGLTLDDLVTLSGTHTHALECWRINCDFHFSPGLTVSTRLSIAGVAHWRAGGHTIGSAHCTTFGERFRVDANGSTVPADAAMNADYAGGLIRACSAVNNTVSSTAAVDCDEGSASRFDNAYFANLLAGRGLLRTDAVLVQNATTRATVEAFARSEGSFFASWAASFARLTSLGVRTGADGEVRRTCSRVNG